MRDSFVLYASQYDAIENLSDVEIGQIVRKLFLKITRDEDYICDSKLADGIAKSFFPNIYAASKRYEASVNNGKKGGAPKGNQNAKKQPKTTQEQPTGYFEEEENSDKNNLKQPKNNLNDNVNDNDNVNEKVNDNDNVNEILLPESTSIKKKEEHDVDINTDCNTTSYTEEKKVEATGSKAKKILDNFKKGDNTRFPTMDELRAIFIKENIHFTDEDFKNNSSGIINGKYKISPRNAAGAVNKYIRKPIIDYGFWYDSDNKDIQNAVISYINKNKLNVVVGHNY